MAGNAGRWYERAPSTVATWTARVESIRAGTKDMRWLEALRPAFAAHGRAAARLDRVANGRGVVVTTGQQPGLFGGPIYTWSKALSALALADELEAATGLPVAPVFWAATDDADFAEASWTAVAMTGGAERLVMPAGAPIGRPMSEMPLGDPADALATFIRACGSTVNDAVLDAVRDAYRTGATVGGAYVTLLRRVFEPLGIAVLDAAHASVAASSRPMLVRALDRASDLADGLRQRDAEIVAAGYATQVLEVEGLSLVFERRGDGGEKRRIPIAEAGASIASGRTILSPNVLLRPVIERALVPTVAYVAGPGEISYFAQVSTVADALGLERPLVVPRWSTTILEPHIVRILSTLGLSEDELADPHRAEGRLAADAVPPAVVEALAALGRELDRRAETLTAASAAVGLAVPPNVFEGTRRSVHHRLDRLERRIIASVKHREHETMVQIGTARGALYPLGSRQERALNLMPIIARHGGVVLDGMLDGARTHARALVGTVSLGDRPEDRLATQRNVLGGTTPGRGVSAEGSRSVDV
jgi:bacillithiol biosynthesis cysteine-adding enzyme BshC